MSINKLVNMDNILVRDNETKPVLICKDEITGKIIHLDIGSKFCKKSLLYYFGLANEFIPTFKCSDDRYVHKCYKLTDKQIMELKNK
jgi:hypothetical protein